MPINSFLYPGAKVVQPFEVSNSLRFDDGSSDTLQRTADSSSSTKGTLSFWCKRTVLDADQRFFNSNGVSDPYFQCYFRSQNDLRFQTYSGGASVLNFITNRLFRDVSAWYHIIITFDTTQSTSTDRVKLYVNGVQETSFSTSTYPSQNANIRLNHGIFRIGGTSTGSYFDGYLAEVVYCDGQALDPTSFGEFDEDSSVWKPIDVSGLTFGTNGFYLDFEDSSSLGNDVSGNNNDFTVNNLTSIDQTTDTCTNNGCTWSSVIPQTAGISGRHSSSQPLLEDGNLSAGAGSAYFSNQGSTFGITQGKWYAEFQTTGDTYAAVGIANNTYLNANLGSYLGGVSTSGTENIGYQSSSGAVKKNNSTEYTGSTYTTSGDIVMIAVDLDNNYIYFGKNNTWQNSGDPTSGATGTGGVSITADTYFITCTAHNSSGANDYIRANFGSPPFSITSGNSDANGYGNFEYSVPSGYYALNTKNLAEYG